MLSLKEGSRYSINFCHKQPLIEIDSKTRSVFYKTAETVTKTG